MEVPGSIVSWLQASNVGASNTGLRQRRCDLVANQIASSASKKHMTYLALLTRSCHLCRSSYAVVQVVVGCDPVCCGFLWQDLTRPHADPLLSAHSRSMLRCDRQLHPERCATPRQLMTALLHHQILILNQIRVHHPLPDLEVDVWVSPSHLACQDDCR
jgi:hypothetical protein